MRTMEEVDISRLLSVCNIQLNLELDNPQNALLFFLLVTLKIRLFIG
uniref:Uncharacterized protein n=1 Tax=Lepeophtheirus salmonis TaxID=72036 RepID=A0A0K2TPP5_LEPSM